MGCGKGTELKLSVILKLVILKAKNYCLVVVDVQLFFEA